MIAPPALYLLLAREHLRSGIDVAAQNVFDQPNGAFTGEISVEQLKDSNITWTLLGHSERRVVLQEDNAVRWAWSGGTRCERAWEFSDTDSEGLSLLRVRRRLRWTGD